MSTIPEPNTEGWYRFELVCNRQAGSSTNHLFLMYFDRDILGTQESEHCRCGHPAIYHSVISIDRDVSTPQEDGFLYRMIMPRCIKCIKHWIFRLFIDPKNDLLNKMLNIKTWGDV